VVIDCDVHQGNAPAIFRGDPSSSPSRFTARTTFRSRRTGDLDIELADGTGDRRIWTR